MVGFGSERDDLLLGSPGLGQENHWHCEENSEPCRVGVLLVGVQDSGFLHGGKRIPFWEVGLGIPVSG